MTKTSFANGINPFVALMPVEAPAKPKPKPKLKPQAHDPDRKKRLVVDVEAITISNDPFPDNKPFAKYERKFKKMKPGQCLECKSQEVKAVTRALQEYSRSNFRTTYFVRGKTDYPEQGQGRVWLLERGAQ